MPVRPGIECLRDDQFSLLAGRRVGLMTNPSAVDSSLRSTFDILWGAPEVNLTAIFGPEHGFVAAASEGEAIASATDARTGLPVYSLYGDTVRPTEEMLAALDVMVCDIQDVGVRFYTYLWTISYILEAAAEYDVEVVILDRPNPLGGEVIAGPLLDPELASYVGRFPIPVRYGMTIGELAQMMNDRWLEKAASFTVVPCGGWRRDMTWPQTGLPWIPTSPNVPHFSTVLQYPGACLVEGTTLSEGRGTSLPFEIIGAPWVDGIALAQQLNSQDLPGVHFRPHGFRPSSSKWAGVDCAGVQVHLIDASAFDALQVWLCIIQTVHRLYPDTFEWLPPHHGVYHFDRLIGTSDVRRCIDEDESLDGFFRAWEKSCEQFRIERLPYLLYE